MENSTLPTTGHFTILDLPDHLSLDPHGHWSFWKLGPLGHLYLPSWNTSTAGRKFVTSGVGSVVTSGVDLLHQASVDILLHQGLIVTSGVGGATPDVTNCYIRRRCYIRGCCYISGCNRVQGVRTPLCSRASMIFLHQFYAFAVYFSVQSPKFFGSSTWTPPWKNSWIRP